MKISIKTRNVGPIIGGRVPEAQARRQKSEDRRRKSEDSRQKTEDRNQKTERKGMKVVKGVFNFGFQILDFGLSNKKKGMA